MHDALASLKTLPRRRKDAHADRRCIRRLTHGDAADDWDACRTRG
jgi:hypothetical protein